MNPYIDLNRFEYVITYACTANCMHCCNSGKDTSAYPPHVDPVLAVDVLERTARCYDLTSVMTFGGEPLLYPEIVGAIHAKAAELGIESRAIITNGYWSKDPNRTRDIASSLAANGVNKISLSVDAFHQACVPLQMVIYSVECLLDSGIDNISLNPCWLTSPDADNAYNRETSRIISEFAGLDVRIGHGNVVTPSGGAVANLPEYFEKRHTFEATSCADLPYTDSLDNVASICMEPDGSIPRCKRFMLGNAADTDIETLFETYDPYRDPEMRSVLNDGIQCDAPSEDGYYTLCEMCCSCK